MGFIYFRYYNVLDRPFYERTIFSYLSGMKVTIEDGLPYLLKANEGLFHMVCVFHEPYYISSIFTLVSLLNLSMHKTLLHELAVFGQVLS